MNDQGDPSFLPSSKPKAASSWRSHAIRQLNAYHRKRIIKHLLALTPQDRYLRFGYAANDDQIKRYAEGLNFEQDSIFGIYNWRLQLIAMAHLAYSVDSHFAACAEFGVSVLTSARGRGLGRLLFERAVMHARNEGVSMMFIHALSENTAMIKIARRAGAVIEQEAGEAQAYLRLPAATFDSRVAEMIEEQIAQTDYKLKSQARQFLRFLAELQSIRKGVQEGRHKSGS
jgi:GNAT superfamily N-acetyltransferase